MADERDGTLGLFARQGAEQIRQLVPRERHRVLVGDVAAQSAFGRPGKQDRGGIDAGVSCHLGYAIHGLGEIGVVAMHEHADTRRFAVVFTRDFRLECRRVENVLVDGDKIRLRVRLRFRPFDIARLVTWRDGDPVADIANLAATTRRVDTVLITLARGRHINRRELGPRNGFGPLGEQFRAGAAGTGCKQACEKK